MQTFAGRTGPIIKGRHSIRGKCRSHPANPSLFAPLPTRADTNGFAPYIRKDRPTRPTSLPDAYGRAGSAPAVQHAQGRTALRPDAANADPGTTKGSPKAAFSFPTRFLQVNPGARVIE
ncbi:hypothetical protein SZ55_3284 [Pseudomonas sp. FeS53a]|nr:hypothetical protein SZ55_3284 [Pseudomonas sp. FeS53a]